MGSRTAEKTKKKFIECFSDIGLKITIKSNMKIVNFLDVILNLTNGKYSPSRKPDNPHLFINVQSNHPPAIIRQLPRAISNRVSQQSSDLEQFSNAAPAYNKALRSSGFTETIEFSDTANESPIENTRNRGRNIL